MTLNAFLFTIGNKFLFNFQITAGIPASRIVLGGFSQGGALAFYSGLTGSVELGGILALSTWLPLDKSIKWKTIQKPPVLYCHGDQDNMISIFRAVKTARKLEAKLPAFTFKMYPGLDHTINSEQEVKDITEFLGKVLPPNECSKL